MTRKIGGFILTFALIAVALGTADAQQARVYRIGYLASANPRELGYVEGQNLAIDFRNAEGRLDRLPPSSQNWSVST